ncbi:hypothetical protein IGI04_025560 [Brassica rapa subsp. trilocularis]|uniref:CCHC-type domain-containing protein n=1 Tax=Brassica rapa subsp. trilocularis TaxID=1813537 RepID=A0ABQ7KTU0_BRACM|nr:hypothetical protein IGI04_025560 [Brassica rapa subsp. trilocularis]
MFGLFKKSKPQQDVYFLFKTVFEKEQLIFDKKQFASNGFDFVHKQNKRQNRCDDEKWVRSGDRPFTKAKRSNRDVPDQNELQTYASLEKMLHKAIHVVRQLKKKGNNNTSSVPKQQSNSFSLSNSDLKTNVLSSDKSKAVKTTSKALSTRCFKCHRVGHYANKCQKQKSLVTLEKVETEPEKKTFYQFSMTMNMNLRKGQVESKIVIIKKDSLPFTNRTELKVSNVLIMEGNDVPQATDHYMEPAQHGVQDVLNISTKVHVFHRTRLDLGRARLSLGGEETKDGHAFSFGGPSGQSRRRPYLYPVHPSGSDESGHLDWSSPFSFIGVNRLVDLVVSQFIFVCCLVVSQRTTFFLRWLTLDRGYIKSHSASLDDPFNPYQFQTCRLPSRIISNTQLK